VAAQVEGTTVTDYEHQILNDIRLRWFGECVGGPYDGMTLGTADVEPPNTLVVDTGAFRPVENNGSPHLVKSINSAGCYDHIFSAVKIDNEWVALEEMFDGKGGWSARMLGADYVTAENGSRFVLVACKYQWKSQQHKESR
jgi:hypothetical protein